MTDWRLSVRSNSVRELRYEAARSVQRVRIRQVRDGRIRFSVKRVRRARDVHEAIRPYYLGADREILSVPCLDSHNQPTSFNVVAIGDLNITRARPVEIVKPAILSNALSIILFTII